MGKAKKTVGGLHQALARKNYRNMHVYNWRSWQKTELRGEVHTGMVTSCR